MESHCCACEREYAIMYAAREVAQMKAQDDYTCTPEQQELTKLACEFLTRKIKDAMLPKMPT